MLQLGLIMKRREALCVAALWFCNGSYDMGLISWVWEQVVAWSCQSCKVGTALRKCMATVHGCVGFPCVVVQGKWGGVCVGVSVLKCGGEVGG